MSELLPCARLLKVIFNSRRATFSQLKFRIHIICLMKMAVRIRL